MLRSDEATRPEPVVARLSTTPVKSTRILQVEHADLTSSGIRDDRRFFVIDDADRLQTARKVGGLLGIRATLGAGRRYLTLTFPDGSAVTAPVERGEPITATYGGDPIRARRLPGAFDEALSSALGRAARLVDSEEHGTAQDAQPFTLVSSASIRAIARLEGSDVPLDPRRFRMNVELDGCEPFEEDGWAGRLVAVGSALLEIGERVGRCVVTTLDPDTGQKSLDVLALLAHRGLPREAGLPLGVYARVIRPGVIAVGDLARFVEQDALRGSADVSGRRDG